jgi:hypothetical protein
VEETVHQHEIFDHMAKLEKVEVYGNIFAVDELAEQYKRYFVVVDDDDDGDDEWTERDMDCNEWWWRLPDREVQFLTDDAVAWQKLENKLRQVSRSKYRPGEHYIAVEAQYNVAMIVVDTRQDQKTDNDSQKPNLGIQVEKEAKEYYLGEDQVLSKSWLVCYDGSSSYYWKN